MDYILASALRRTNIKKVVVSYNLACQWRKKLLQRVQALPGDLSSKIFNLVIDAVLPKLHEHAHKELCHTDYSFNFLQGAGRTDGEGIEHRWSDTNNAATSTRKMREGHREDTLDDVCNDSNYRKTVDLGMLSRSFTARR